jgi:hypothetical protein
MTCTLLPATLAQVQKAAMRILPGSLEDSDAVAVVSFTGTNSGMIHDRAKLQEPSSKISTRKLLSRPRFQDTLTCANLDPRAFRTVAEGMTRSAASRALVAGDRDVHLTLGFLKEVIKK